MSFYSFRLSYFELHFNLTKSRFCISLKPLEPVHSNQIYQVLVTQFLWNCTVLIYTETQKVKAEELVDTGIGNTRKLQKLLVENRVFL